MAIRVQQFRSGKSVCRWVSRYVATMCQLGNVVVVFDIDDTLLYTDKDDKTQRIEHVFRLLQMCIQKEAKVHLVTARPSCSQRETVNELKRHGIVRRCGSRRGYESINFVRDGAGVDEIPEYKQLCRRKAAGPDEATLVTIGDQWWDVIGSDRQIDHTLANVFKSLERTDQPPDVASTGSFVLTRYSATEPASVGVKLPEL